VSPYIINHDYASKMIHDKARSDGRCHLDRIAPKSYERAETLAGLNLKGYKECSWCME
jgi:hypothetical protein